MICKKLQDAINSQINAELWSAYLYLSMSLDAESKALKGAASWFWVQWLEEQDHARIFQNFLNSQEVRVELMPIVSVPTEWPTLLHMFKDTLEHEMEVTAMIRRLVSIARDQQDCLTFNRLQWFVDEQSEEERQARDLINLLEFIGESPYGLLQFDRELGERRYHKPPVLDE